jgi:hemolysin activation/secretion protein
MSLLRLAARTAGLAASAATISWAGGAFAQAIQRYLPPAPQSQPTAPAPANIGPVDQDATPIGPALSGLFLLGPTDALEPAAPGLDTAKVKRMDTPEGRAVLAPFFGRPLSRKLIGQVEAAVARYYRRHGYPFISLSTPEQNITTGVLQVRVIEFRAGQVKVKGAKSPDEIRDGVRLKPGEDIDADQLAQDLDWLNRYLFRHVEAVFSPGDALGQSDVTLQTTETRPFHVYAGYSNSGSAETQWDRYFVGASVGGLLVPGSLVSYQFTASPNFYSGSSDPGYLSHGVRFSVPTGERQDFEGTFDYVEMDSSTRPGLMTRQNIEELTLGYRSAISNFIALPGDLTGGVEVKSLSQKTSFQSEDVQNGLAEVYQFYAGYTDAWSNRIGHGDLSVTVHFSPGDLDDRNDSTNFSTFSNGRITSATYAYGTLQADQIFRLPNRWTLSESLVAQYGSGALPQTEQMAVGGQSLVRGYSIDDGSYDNGFVLRSELHAPTFTLARGEWVNAVAPYAFFDFGHGWEREVGTHAAPASVGAGFDDQLTAHLTASLDYAYALNSALETRSGDSRLDARVTVGF